MEIDRNDAEDSFEEGKAITRNSIEAQVQSVLQLNCPPS